MWPSESADFTPWIADNLGLLEILEIGPLLLEATEHRVEGSGRSLDVLAQTAWGARVAIENQFSTGDHDHLTRGLASAVGVEAHYLVVIAEGHQSEFRRVADYLNQSAGNDTDLDRRIGVFLVDLSVERVENYFIPRLEVVVRPEWATADTSRWPHRLGSVDEFLDNCSADRRAVMSAIIRTHLSRPGASETHDTQACLALYLTNPVTGRPTNITQLYTDGKFVACRGYVFNSPIFTDEKERLTFDDQLTKIFGEYRPTPKNYYPNMGPVSAEQADAYATVVADQYASWKPDQD